MQFQINSRNFKEEYQTLVNSKHVLDLNSDAKVLVLGNIRLQNLITNGSFDPIQNIKKYKYYLDYGLIILFRNDSIEIYNDIFGAYPLFLHEMDNLSSLTNVFKFTKSSELNEIAIIEQIHFNHFLGTNTLCKNTKRIAGGSKIKISSEGVSIEEVYSWDDFLFDLNHEELTKSPFEYLNDYISQSIDSSRKLTLTLTGGYDSRMLFGVLLKNKIEFDTVTWSKEESSQVSVARDVAKKFGKHHDSLYLDSDFDLKIRSYIDDIINSESELPFITDVPPFLHLCNFLERNQNLISGFMGSEIIRGPSYSSEVTLTKFAATIQLCTNKQEIRQKIRDFQSEFQVISNEFIEENLEILVNNYAVYARIGLNEKLKNVHIFKYLFKEKYPKIFGHILNLHQSKDINTINPYLDFKFILSALRYNSAMEKMTPYENNWFQNFKLYRFYANLIKEHSPMLLETPLDRGYKLNDLITLHGLMKLVPYQFYRKWKKRNSKPKIVVDSFNWYYKMIKEIEIENDQLNKLIANEFILKIKNSNESLNSREKILIQHIFAINYKINNSRIDKNSKI
jgi:hypothetical protein